MNNRNINLYKKLGIKWEERHDTVLSREIRIKIIDKLIEPFKKRGKEREKLLEENPRLIDENGNRTEKLIGSNGKFDGCITENGYDNKGIYSIFKPKKSNEIDKWLEIEDKKEKLSILVKKQRELADIDDSINKKDYTDLKKEIDNLFIDVLDLNKPEEETLAKEKEKDKKAPPHWHEIAPFFISGQINKLQQNQNGNLNAKDFSEIVLKEYEIPLKIDQIRPYLQSTLFNSNGTTKDLYSKSKILALIKFSENNNLAIKDDFLLRKIKEYNIDYNS